MICGQVARQTRKSEQVIAETSLEQLRLLELLLGTKQLSIYHEGKLLLRFL